MTQRREWNEVQFAAESTLEPRHGGLDLRVASDENIILHETDTFPSGPCTPILKAISATSQTLSLATSYLIGLANKTEHR